jgi:hypothetical protein
LLEKFLVGFNVNTNFLVNKYYIYFLNYLLKSNLN